VNELIKLVMRDRNKQRQRRKGIKKKKVENLANVTGHLSKSKGLQVLGSLNMETTVSPRPCHTLLKSEAGCCKALMKDKHELWRVGNSRGDTRIHKRI